jgi:hypothetical protein
VTARHGGAERRNVLINVVIVQVDRPKLTRTQRAAYAECSDFLCWLKGNTSLVFRSQLVVPGV